MSILDDAKNFYKIICDSPNREEVKTLVGKLKASTRGGGSKIYPAPILGLLLYNQRLVKSYLGVAPVEELKSWDERELKILFGVHNQIRRFNERCLAPLADALPEAIGGVNPYKEYPSPVSTDGFEEFLFRNEDAEEVIRSFHQHPAFKIALSDLRSVKQRPLDYEQTIWQLNSEIVEAGPGGEPQWVANYEQAKRTDHPELNMFRHVAALVSLHISIATLDQFIYHGIFRDEIKLLDRPQIVDYLWTSGHAGPGIWLLHISLLHMLVCEPTDLIMVNIDKPDQRKNRGDSLCSIHMQTISADLSSPGILEVSVIDENLNAYPALIR
ncbi:MAG: hypothetical protein M3362_01245 [Acidobacteriota bacterium]|nr:hypothetical protein [Acidobacteriota bacterium]